MKCIFLELTETQFLGDLTLTVILISTTEQVMDNIVTPDMALVERLIF